jgi:hypothetical protein
MTAQERATSSEVEQFAMIPRRIIESGISDGAFRLYCMVDGRRGSIGWEPFGFHYLAERLGKQTETISRCAHALEEIGFVKVHRGGGGKAAIELLYNPARNLYPATGVLPEIPPAMPRHHKPGSRGTEAHGAELQFLKRRMSNEQVSRSAGTELSYRAGTTIPGQQEPPFLANRNHLNYEDLALRDRSEVVNSEGEVSDVSGYDWIREAPDDLLIGLETSSRALKRWQPDDSPTPDDWYLISVFEAVDDEEVCGRRLDRCVVCKSLTSGRSPAGETLCLGCQAESVLHLPSGVCTQCGEKTDRVLADVFTCAPCEHLLVSTSSCGQ